MIKTFLNLFRQPAHQTQVDLTEGVLPYGKDNNFPLRLATMVQSSPTGAAGVSIISEFIEGAGFSDQSLKDIVINGRGETFGILHSLTCESWALYRGFAWLIKYNAQAQITEIFNIPFENVRLCKPDSRGVISKVRVNPYFGTSEYRKSDSVEYDVFTPNQKQTLAQIAKQTEKFKGQILYVGQTRPLSRFYPEPEYYSAQGWLKIDAGIQDYHSNNLEAGFFQTVLLKMIGNPDDPSTHPDDQSTDDQGNKISIRTRGERFNIAMQEFTGADSKTKMLVLWEQLKDQMPELQAFPQITNENFFTNLQETCDRKILIAMKVPGILVNMGRENSLSDGAQMANATKVMQDRVKKPQNMLENYYMQVLKMFATPYVGEVKIINGNTFQELETIDPSIWEVLTPEEKRQWIKENTEYPISNAPAPMPVSNFKDIFFTDYPEGAKKNAAKALKYSEDHPGCGTPMGKRRGADISEGRPLSFKDIKSTYNFLKRNAGFENTLFSDSCNAVLFSMWGGKPMLDYCADKIKFVNE
jgi:hypothetical protein